MKHSHVRGRYGNPAGIRAYVRRMLSRQRASWQRPGRLVSALGLRRGDTVGEVGCGAGYFTLRMSRRVGSTGSLLAVDVEPRILEVLRTRVARERVHNVTPVLGTARDPLLPPRSCDLILLVNVLHHYRSTAQFLRTLSRALSPGGRIANVDFHKRDLPVGPERAHKISEEAFVRHARSAGLSVSARHTFLPYQYFVELRPRRRRTPPVAAPRRRVGR